MIELKSAIINCNKISRFFGSKFVVSILDPTEVSFQNDRLQQELDQTKMENKNLTKQMTSWKEQLLDIGKYRCNHILCSLMF